MYFDDLKIGMMVDTAPAVIEKEKMVAFARDDNNIPLHTDEKHAKFMKYLEKQKSLWLVNQGLRVISCTLLP